MEIVLSPLDIELGRLRAFELRMRVWWARDRLTCQLASGAASVDSRELAFRAGQLTARRTREVVAASIEDLLEQTSRPRPLLSSQVPLDLAKVRAAHDQLSRLAARLREPRPLRPQGMALVVLLMTDPERPLYGLGSADDLSGAIIHASERLEP
jgi:HPt (histidine-containing phosphotransfer) domain-containing protein